MPPAAKDRPQAPPTATAAAPSHDAAPAIPAPTVPAPSAAPDADANGQGSLDSSQPQQKATRSGRKPAGRSTRPSGRSGGRRTTSISRPRQPGPDDLIDLGNFPPPTADSERLIVENLDLARSRAHSWARRCRESYEDLEAVAFVGLMRGCRRYDPSRGAALSTCCWPYINGAIQHWLRDRGHLVRYPMLWRESWGRVSWLLSQPGATPASVAAELGIDPAELEEMAGAMGQDRGVLNEEVVSEAAGPDAMTALGSDGEDLLGPVDEVVQRSLRAMPPGDRDALLEWIEAPRRRMVPMPQIQVFLHCCRAGLRGLRLVEYRQRRLLERGADPLQTPGRRRRLPKAPATGLDAEWQERGEQLRDDQAARRRSMEELAAAAVQLSLVPAAAMVPAKAAAARRREP